MFKFEFIGETVAFFSLPQRGRWHAEGVTDEESGLQNTFLVSAIFSLFINGNPHQKGLLMRLSSSTASRSPFPAGEGISLRSRTGKRNAKSQFP